MNNYKSRNTTPRGLLHTPARSIVPNLYAASGSGSSCDNSSPDDAPLTVNHTRPARRRRIIESDDEGGATPNPVDERAVSLVARSSPRRQLGSRQPTKAPIHQQEHRALQNLTNLPSPGPSPGPACSMAPTALPTAPHSSGAAVLEGPGKRGILELVNLLCVETSSSHFGVDARKGAAAASNCYASGLATHAAPSPSRTPPALASMQQQPQRQRPSAAATLVPGEPGARRLSEAAAGATASWADDDSGGSDDAELPLVFQRSVRAPRTLQRRAAFFDGSSSDSERDPSESAGPLRAVQALRAHRCEPEATAIPYPASGQASQGSHLSFHSARSDEGDCGSGSAATGVDSGGHSSRDAEQAGRQQRQPSCILAPDPGPCAAAGAIADTSRPGTSHLAKVPRRRQGQRDGRDAAGEAAAFPLAGTGAAVGTLTATGWGAAHGRDSVARGSGCPDGLMYDLYGELQLLNQLRDMTLAADGPADGSDSDISCGGDDRYEQPQPLDRAPESPPSRSSLHLRQPQRTGAAAPEVMDLTLLSCSSSSSSGDGDYSATSGSRGAISGEGAPAGQLSGVRSSPAGLLDTYRQAHPGVKASPIGNPASELPPAGVTGPGAAGGGLGGGSEPRADSDDSGSEAGLQHLGAHWKRPPTTARRRAVVLDSSPEASSPPPPQQQRQQPGMRGVFEWVSGLRADALGGAETSDSDDAGWDFADSPGVYGAAEALASPTVAGAGAALWQSSIGAANPTEDRRGGSRTPAPTYDPYEAPTDDEFVLDSSGVSVSDSDSDDVRDCSLETPLPPFRPLFSTRTLASGRGFDHRTPASERPPLPLRTPGAGLDGAAPPTAPGRKDQRRGDEMVPGGTREPPPQQQLTAAAGGRVFTKPRSTARAAGMAEQRAFLAARARLAQDLYAKWNADVFGARLPADLPLVWNSRLSSTAGQVVAQRELPGAKRRVPAKLELSPRLIDSLEKLRNTLSHEMCHVAAWHISHEYDRPHGPAWESWAARFTRHDPSLLISRTHDYITQYAHRWRCTRKGCGKEYGRQRQTIRVGVHVCAACHSQLEYLGHFDKNGNLKAPRATPAAAAGNGGGHALGTATKPLNEFAQFLKENFQNVRSTLPAKTPNSAVFKHMGQLFQRQKANLAATAAAGGAAAAQGGGGGGRRRDPGSPSAGPRSAEGRLTPSREDDDLLVPRLIDLSLADEPAGGADARPGPEPGP